MSPFCGPARLEQDDPRTLELEFWMYDIMDAEADFTQRNEQMLEMAEELNITSDCSPLFLLRIYK